MKKKLAFGLGGLLAALVFVYVHAAADLDLLTTGATTNVPFYLLDVDTAAASKILVRHDYSVTIAHTGFKADGSASGTSDYLVIMQQSATMAANRTAGAKIMLPAGASVTLYGADFKNGVDGAQELQIQAVTGTAKVQFIMAPFNTNR